MDFDLHELNYTAAILNWMAAFFGSFSVAALLAWAFAPAVGGRNARTRLYRWLTRGVGGVVCWASLGLYLVGVLAVVVYGLNFPEVRQGLSSDLNAYATAARLPLIVVQIGAGLFAGLVLIATSLGAFMLWPVVAHASSFSPRRVWAIAMLTWKEAIRRRALYVFVVFAFLFMFAGWFLSNPNAARAGDVVKVYVTFVLTTVTWLTLPVVLLLACWGIPDDIKARSLHTVVTKPVRRNEVFLGRFLGFSLVGSAVVLVMGSIGYLWIVRQVPASVRQGAAMVDGREVRFGSTSDGDLEVEIDRARGEPRIVVASTPADLRRDDPEAFDFYERARDRYVDQLLVSRVPQHGTISFFDPVGRPTETGINVGDIWEHRSYVEGGSRARGAYHFTNVTPDLMIDETVLRVDDAGNETTEQVRRLMIETSFEAFRTFKGKMDRSLLVQFHFVRKLRREVAEGVAGSSLGEPGVIDFRPASRLVEQGNFTEAADDLERRAHGIATGQLKLSPTSFRLLAGGYARVSKVFRPFGEEWSNAIATVASEVSSAARSENVATLGRAMGEFAQLVRTDASTLEEHIADLDVPYTAFTVKEFVGNVELVPRTLKRPGTAETVDLFDDVVHGGELTIEVACLDGQQYLGMARTDLFIRRPDRTFLEGYSKALLGIWLLVVIVVLVGVTVSTFVKGPVATLATVAFVFVGVFSHEFLRNIVSGEEKGAGAIESSYRLYAHLNPNVGLDDSTAVRAIQTADTGIKSLLWIVSNVIPDLNVFFLNEWVANGFDVNWEAGLAPAVFTVLAYLLPCLLLGYYSLKLRELEAK